jgi:hypothetical protein
MQSAYCAGSPLMAPMMQMADTWALASRLPPPPCLPHRTHPRLDDARQQPLLDAAFLALLLAHLSLTASFSYSSALRQRLAQVRLYPTTKLSPSPPTSQAGKPIARAWWHTDTGEIPETRGISRHHMLRKGQRRFDRIHDLRLSISSLTTATTTITTTASSSSAREAPNKKCASLLRTDCMTFRTPSVSLPTMTAWLWHERPPLFPAEQNITLQDTQTLSMRCTPFRSRPCMQGTQAMRLLLSHCTQAVPRKYA